MFIKSAYYSETVRTSRVDLLTFSQAARSRCTPCIQGLLSLAGLVQTLEQTDLHCNSTGDMSSVFQRCCRFNRNEKVLHL